MATTTEILVLGSGLPLPAEGPAALRCWQMLRFLARHYRVHFGCLAPAHPPSGLVGKVQAVCHETHFIDQPALLARARGLGALVRGEAPAVASARHPALAAWTTRLLQRRPVAAAIALSAPMAQYLPATPGLRRLLDLAAKPVAGARDAAYALATASRFDAVLLATPNGAADFAGMAPCARVACIPNGVDAEHFSPHIMQRNPYRGATINLLFSGALEHWPDIEAADWLVRQVFSPLHARHGCLRLHLVGSGVDRRVQALARHPGVQVHAAVSELRPYLAHAALVLAPLRQGAGMQAKVLEAMAMQKVVIASPAALDGIAAVAGTELLVAHTKAEFIAQVRQVLAADASDAMGLAARARVLADYSWSASMDRLIALIGTPAARSGT
ncbi:MAG: glycosyltransferase [Pseudomonadota bacterium]